MTKRFRSLLVLAAASLSPVLAQNLEPNFMMMSYINVPLAQRDAYEKFVKTEGVKLGQAAIESGLIRGRTMLKLTAPFLNSEKYQYALTMWYDKAPTMDEAGEAAWDAAAKKAGFASYADYLAKSRAAGAQIVYNEIRRANMRVGTVEVGDFVRTMAYQIPTGETDDFLERLRTLGLPLMKDSLQPDHIKAYLVSSRILPNGKESDANLFQTFVTKTSADILVNPNPLNEARFKKVHPNGNYAEYIRDNADWARRAPLVRTRTMRVISSVGKLPEPRPTN